MAAFIPVAQTSEIPLGTGKACTVKGSSIALFNVEGTIYAIDNVCPHRGGPIAEGGLQGSTAICPWHGWTFDVKTGSCLAVPSAAVKSFEVKIEGTEVLVAIPWINP